MPLLKSDDPLPAPLRRVLVAGSSGAGKTTLAAVIGAQLGLPHVEIDSLFHGPGWTPRPSFVLDVERLAAADGWVTEWQYDVVRELLGSRADLLVWLDLPLTRVMRQLVRRTVVRRLRRQELWNGNREAPLWTFFTDREHVVRCAWATYGGTGPRVRALLERRPDLAVVRLGSRREVDRWVAGPLGSAARRCGG